MVAIPLLVVHALLATKTNEIVDGMEMASVKVLTAISTRARRQTTAQAA
jgi:biopolymer transport protein ExbB